MSQTARSGTLITTQRDRLLAMAHASGGWPYYAARSARIEPTCWALLALAGANANPRETAAVAGGRTFLNNLTRADGLLVEPATPGPNYGWNGLALLALNSKDDLAAADRLASALVEVKGIQVATGQAAVRQNSQLQAWSWTEGTFSWIEPTAWCLLGLKVRRVTAPAVATRVREAEAVILDRVCDPGGWNYGNSQVLSQDLRPYVPTTALALLAMQDKREHPAVLKSLEWLSAHAVSEKAAMALSLAAICLHVYGRPTDEVLRALEAQDARTRFLDNAHLLAMATYALTLPTHRAVAMTVA